MHKRSVAKVALVLLLAGCASAPQRPVQIAPDLRRELARPEPPGPGTWHTVARGETLWSIARGYAVEVGAILKENQVPDVTKIEVGTRLFIPGATVALPVQVPRSPNALGFVRPTGGEVMRGFGRIIGDIPSAGIDMEARPGEAVAAVADGEVSFVSNDFAGLGQAVMIDHGGALASLYAGLSTILVSRGQRVERGGSIGLVGEGGREGQVLLHFRIFEAGTPVDPLKYLD